MEAGSEAAAMLMMIRIASTTPPMRTMLPAPDRPGGDDGVGRGGDDTVGT
jgi:hypothetical protein